MEDCETCFIEVKTHAKQKNLIIGSIYRHPHDSNLDEFFSEFIKTAEKIPANNSIVLAGDFNINTSKSNETTVSKQYKDLLLSLGLTNLISKPTRIANSSETILDHILANVPLQKLNCGVVRHVVADHLPTFAIFNSTVQNRSAHQNSYYCIIDVLQMIKEMNF